MVVQNIRKIHVKKVSPKKPTGSVILTIDYNDNEQYEINFRNEGITKDTVIILFAYYYILDRYGYLNTFFRLITECELLVNHETYRQFTVEERLSNTGYNDAYVTMNYDELLSFLNIDWDNLKIYDIIDFSVEYIDDETP